MRQKLNLKPKLTLELENMTDKQADSLDHAAEVLGEAMDLGRCHQAIEDYKEVIEDKRRIAREIAVMIDGEYAAPQPSLCDIQSMVQMEIHRRDVIQRRAQGLRGLTTVNPETIEKRRVLILAFLRDVAQGITFNDIPEGETWPKEGEDNGR